MRIILKILLFHLCCILAFAYIYYTLSTGHFTDYLGKTPKPIDYLFLSTTIQSGVGYTKMFPKTTLAKYFLIIQQFLIISVYVVVLYTFTGNTNFDFFPVKKSK